MLWTWFIVCITAWAGLPTGLPAAPDDVVVTSSSDDHRHRISFASPHDTVVFEITATTDAPSGETRCTGGPLALTLVAGDIDTHDGIQAWAQQACFSLHGITLPAVARAQAEAQERRHEHRPSPRVRASGGLRAGLRACMVLGWIGLCFLMPRRRTPYALAALALIARLAAQGPSILMGAAYPYGRMLGAIPGEHGAISALYSEGWPAIMGWMTRIIPSAAYAVQGVNLLLSAATVAVFWAVMRHSLGERIATASTLLLAVHPLHLHLAQTPTMFVLVAFLQTVAALGLVHPHRAGAIMSLCAMALLLHVRPFQAAMLLPFTIGWAIRKRWWVVAAIVPVAIHRATLVFLTVPDVKRLDALTETTWSRALQLDHLVGQGGSILVMDPTAHPLLWSALLLGAAFAVRHKRTATAALAGVFVVSLVPYLPFHRPTDILRMALPSTMWACGLIGVGWMHLPRGWRPWAGGALAISALATADPQGETFLWQAEHEAMMRLTDALPSDVPVRFRAGVNRDGHLPRWMTVVGRGPWRALRDGPARAGELYWRGRADAFDDPWSPPCTVTPIAEEHVVGTTQGIEPQPSQPVIVGLYRFVDCDAPTP